MNKYEKCVLAVKGKQPKSCERKKWQGSGCYNPWAVCTKSVGKPKKLGRPRKSCPEGQIRDKITKRCRSRKASRKPRKVTPSKKSRKVSRKTSRKPRKG